MIVTFGHFYETGRLKNFTRGLFIIRKEVLAELAKMIVNVFQACCAVRRVPLVLCASLKIRGIDTVLIINEWPLRIGNAEGQHSTWTQDTQALPEQIRDWLWIIDVLKEMLRKNDLATVRL